MTSNPYLASTSRVAIRHIEPGDLPQVARFEFTVSITEPLTDPVLLSDAFEQTGFWQDESGAVAIVEPGTGRLLGTLQFYRTAPCIHGYELGYILHETADRGHGYAPPALRLFSDHLFEARPGHYRQQLMIEAWNVASWKTAERAGFVREGLLRSSGFGTGDPADCFIYSRTRKDWHEEQISRMGVPVS